jgi:hypothetical protein
LSSSVADAARRNQCKARGHQHGAVGAFEDGAHRLDRTSVVGAILGETGEVMVEGGVDDGVRLACAVAKAFQIF